MTIQNRLYSNWDSSSMPRRRVLTDAQITVLFARPATEADLIRHYTLSPDDLAVIARRRAPHNRLGFALQLCALRYPARRRRRCPCRAGGPVRAGGEPVDGAAPESAAPARRRAILAVTVNDTITRLTDETIGLFDRLIGRLFRRAERRAAVELHNNARAINDNLRLFAKIGGALIAEAARLLPASERIGLGAAGGRRFADRRPPN